MEWRFLARPNIHASFVSDDDVLICALCNHTQFYQSIHMLAVLASGRSGAEFAHHFLDEESNSNMLAFGKAIPCRALQMCRSEPTYRRMQQKPTVALLAAQSKGISIIMSLW